MKLALFSFIAFLLAFFSAESEFQLSNWNIYTSMYNVKTAVFDANGRIWGGTDGGLFVYNRQEDTFKEFRTINGLLSLDISKVAYEPKSQKIFAATSDGILHVISMDYSWKYYLDIKNAGFPNPIITGIVFRENLAYIVGGFGLAVFDSDIGIFTETAQKLGSFQQNTKVNGIIIQNDTIWLATESGIAFAPVASTIADPSSWKNITKTDGLVENNVLSVYFFDDALYAATDFNVMKVLKDTIENVLTLDVWNNVVQLGSYKDKLCVMVKYEFQNVDKSKYWTSYTYMFNGFCVNEYSEDKEIVLFTKKAGLGFIDGDSIIYKYAINPTSNVFKSIATAPDGSIWTATDNSGKSNGFMRYHNGKWTNYITLNYPEIKSNYYYKVAVSSKGNLIASGWGCGFVYGKPSGDTMILNRYDNKNSPLTGIDINPDYVLAGEAVFDNKGLAWIVNNGATSYGPLLLALDEDGNFYPFDNCINESNRTFLTLCIDNAGTKWLGSNSNSGLYYFNEKNTLDNAADDICGIINSSNSNLTSNLISACAVDKNGYIWLGTGLGLNVVLNPTAVLNNSIPIIRKINLLSSQSITNIYIDPLNNKWISTPDGVWVLNPEGSDVIAYLTTENTKLPSNAVFSVSMMPETGEVFFGTEQGLVQCSSLNGEPFQNYDIKCYPQPFEPVIDGLLTIDGLAEESQIFIATVSGSRIRRLDAFGRKTIWDGRDDDGNLVPMGIYLVIASSATTDQTAVQKIAVIRK